MSLRNTLRQNVKLRLAFLDTTIAELCRNSDEKADNVRQWYRNESISSKTLERLAKLLGVPANELYSDEFNPRNYPPPKTRRRKTNDKMAKKTKKKKNRN